MVWYSLILYSKKHAKCLCVVTCERGGSSGWALSYAAHVHTHVQTPEHRLLMRVEGGGGACDVAEEGAEKCVIFI